GVLFLFTPKWLVSIVAKYVPGTREHEKSQQDYARKVRDIVSGRIAQFSDVFNQLSSSFKTLGDMNNDARTEMNNFINVIADQSCETCPRRKKCWADDYHRTYQFMAEMMNAIDENPDLSRRHIRPEWKSSCIRTEAVLDAMKQQYVIYLH